MYLAIKFLPQNQTAALSAIDYTLTRLDPKFSQAKILLEKAPSYVTYSWPDTWQAEAAKFQNLATLSPAIRGIQKFLIF